MSSGRTRSNYESFMLAFALFSFAVAILVAWAANRWILFIPVLLIEVGFGYLALGFVIRPMELHKRPVMRDAYYYLLWGSISALLGIEWLVNMYAPGNLPLLVALFVIWMGVLAASLAIGRNREKAALPKQ